MDRTCYFYSNEDDDDDDDELARFDTKLFAGKNRANVE